MSTPPEHYLYRGFALHPTSLEHEATITRKYNGRGRWTVCTCKTCPVCAQLIQTQDDGTLQTHGSGVGLRDICKGTNTNPDDTKALAGANPSLGHPITATALAEAVGAVSLAPTFIEPVAARKSILRDVPACCARSVGGPPHIASTPGHPNHCSCDRCF